MITPMTENMLSVLRHSSSAPTTPIKVSGSELISASGCKKLRNCDARIM